jgi:hypothetical protein
VPNVTYKHHPVAYFFYNGVDEVNFGLKLCSLLQSPIAKTHYTCYSSNTQPGKHTICFITVYDKNIFGDVPRKIQTITPNSYVVVFQEEGKKDETYFLIYDVETFNKMFLIQEDTKCL